ncbi:MAG: hypothetical protein JWM50_2668 [Microbacteriaceae bacterium]|nr:hypothetical protein [Microbacteriaceae bacterium]
MWITRFGLLLLEYGEQMRTDVRRAGVAVAIAAALALTACTPPADGHNPSPSPSVTPLFSSDEEALAAAEEAYAAYVAVTDQIFADGGVGLERLDGVVTGPQMEIERASLEEVATKGYRSIGNTTFNRIELQQYAKESSDEAEVIVYLCQDISSVDVVDSTGVSVVTDARVDRISYEVKFDTASNDDRSLLVSDRSPWSARSC